MLISWYDIYQYTKFVKTEEQQQGEHECMGAMLANPCHPSIQRGYRPLVITTPTLVNMYGLADYVILQCLPKCLNVCIMRVSITSPSFVALSLPASEIVNFIA